jgi:hypothetical protein
MHKESSEASVDEDLIIGSDSDDSFTKDYNIPIETLRKEQIVKRDIKRFEKEKIKREERMDLHTVIPIVPDIAA